MDLNVFLNSIIVFFSLVLGNCGWVNLGIVVGDNSLCFYKGLD